MKKMILAAALSIIMAFSCLTACGDVEGTADSSNTESSAVSDSSSESSSDSENDSSSQTQTTTTTSETTTTTTTSESTTTTTSETSTAKIETTTTSKITTTTEKPALTKNSVPENNKISLLRKPGEYYFNELVESARSYKWKVENIRILSDTDSEFKITADFIEPVSNVKDYVTLRSYFDVCSRYCFVCYYGNTKYEMFTDRLDELKELFSVGDIHEFNPYFF